MTNTLTSVAPEGPRFSISQSLSMTFGVLGRNFVPMMAIAVVVTAIQSVIEYIVNGGIPTEGESSNVSSLLNIISYGVVTAPITYATFQDLRGTRVGLSEMISGGFQKVLPVIGAALVVGIVVAVPIIVAVFLYFASTAIGIVATIATVAFAFFILVAWFVLVPVLVVENVGFIGSFGRAAALSKDRRWGLLGLLLVYFVIVFGILVVLVIIVGVAAATAPIVALILMVPFLALFSVIGAIMPSVVYYLLRSEKEGVGIDEIAKVFD